MGVIETIEVLLREYELNSIENNNSYTVRNQNAKGQVKRETVTEEVAAAEKESVEEASPCLFVGSKSMRECLTSIALSKGEHIGRGHTAYLTFATKMKWGVCWETGLVIGDLCVLEW